MVVAGDSEEVAVRQDTLEEDSRRIVVAVLARGVDDSSSPQEEAAAACATFERAELQIAAAAGARREVEAH